MSLQTALISLRESRAIAFVQARATVEGNMRRHWQLILRKLDQAIADLARGDDQGLVDALEQSVKLQSHYAELLNIHDGGQRLTFASAEAWLDRLAALRNCGRAEP